MVTTLFWIKEVVGWIVIVLAMIVFSICVIGPTLVFYYGRLGYRYLGVQYLLLKRKIKNRYDGRFGEF